MTQVYISIGSNQNCQRNIAHALSRLREIFGPIHCSPVYRSAAVGGGADYHNLAVGFYSDQSLSALRETMQSIEAELGRDRQQPHHVSMDLDILLYGELEGDFASCRLPHPDMFRYRHVLTPLADIAGDLVPPGSSMTISAMLSKVSLPQEALEVVEEY